MIMSHDEEKYKTHTHTHKRLLKIWTIVNIACDWKQQEDRRLGFKTLRKMTKHDNSYTSVTFLVITLLQLSRLS